MERFKLTTDNEDVKRIIKVYESKNYELRICVYKDDNGKITNYRSAQITNKNNRFETYMPDIYVEDNIMTGELKDVVIQTTSYGGLRIEEINKMMDCMKEAIAEVEEIKEILNIK